MYYGVFSVTVCLSFLDIATRIGAEQALDIGNDTGGYVAPIPHIQTFVIARLTVAPGR